MKCPRCDTEMEGRFCGLCGASLEARECDACGASVPSGHRFCSQCGTAVAGEATGSRGPLGARPPQGRPPPVHSGDAGGDAADRRRWWIAGLAVAGALVFLSLPYVWTGWADQGDQPRTPMGAPMGAPGGAPGLGPAPGVDLSSMTPRQAADRLFNRVMGALGEGNQGEVQSFLPMAIDAYHLVPDLDADGHFHLSLLQQTAGDYQAALETAERALETEPDHLLVLYAAGEAARELDRMELARQHFSHLLDVFDVESARDRPEYGEHASFLPTIREVAADVVAGTE